MADRVGNCVVCHQRNAEHPMVCDLCTSRLAGQLAAIPGLCDDLAKRGDPLWDVRVNVAEHTSHGIATRRWYLSLDPLAAPVPARSSGPRVGGSRNPSAPVSLDAVDLLDRSRPAALTRRHVRQDQIGYLSVATVLDSWAADWYSYRPHFHESPPASTTVADLSQWLSDRLDWACMHHPAVDEFAGELSNVHGALYRKLGLAEPKPELCVGVPCKSPACDQRKLYRQPGGERIVCEACGRLLSAEEYAEWTKALKALTKPRREEPAA